MVMAERQQTPTVGQQALHLTLATGRPRTETDPTLDDVLHLAEVVPLARRRLGLGPDVPDAEILACLAAAACSSDVRGRWMAVFASALGQRLAAGRRDLGTALARLVALLPPPPT
jgi:hypothetical protein